MTIYSGGTILTMEEPLYAEAVLVEDGVIRAVGEKSVLRQGCPPETEEMDLQGAVLLPAFIDPHSHITALAQTLGSVDLTGAKSFAEIVQKLQAFIQKTKPAPGQWVTAFGYDNNFLAEKRHPDRQLLDQIKYPVIVTHASGHMGAANSLGLKEMGVCAETPDPEGGVVGREADGRTPNGYLEETAFSSFTAKIPQPSQEQLLRQMELAQDIYLQNGITTVQDGLTVPVRWEMLKGLAEQNRLKADVVAYPDLKDNRALAAENLPYCKQYCNRLKIGGYKIFLDGSPQGRTAWMTQPYENGEAGYKGYPIYQDAQVESFMREALRDDMQLLVHCNGDAAAQQMIDAYEKVLAESRTEQQIRPVMIHAQLVRQDQLEKMAKLRMIASFFVAHTWYWGDVHLQNFGEARAIRISPARSAIESGVIYTFHQDTPVIQPNMLETIWCAVNRISKNGMVMGEEERVTPLEALRAVTTNAAYQYFEEDEKGSIRAGKRADFVILDRDPLQVNPMDIKDISVLATIKDGRAVYEASR